VADESSYIIRGGPEGRERLRVVARVMAPTTAELLDRVGVAEDAACLDVGCGGGDVALELARRAPRGRVVGVDLDEAKLEIGRAEARAAGVDNVDYRCADLRSVDLGSAFDLVHARFVLTHLTDPQAAADGLVRALRPGGVLVVEDIDYSGSLCEPPHPSFERYVELYRHTARARGVDPDIGPRLPGILARAGCRPVRANVVQPVGRQGEGYERDVKLTAPLTLENIADAVLGAGLAERRELEALADDLYELAGDDETLIGTPRMVQAWGHRPAEPV
jgi:SAM-dependent methyltransferase